MAQLKSPVVEGMQQHEHTFCNAVEEHYPIPALCMTGCVLMRLEFTDDERRQIAQGDDVFVEVLTDGGIQPTRFTVANWDSGDDWRAEGYGETLHPNELTMGNRNVGLEAMARSMSRTHRLWEDLVRDYNATWVKPPLSDGEVQSIIEGVRQWKRSRS